MSNITEDKNRGIENPLVGQKTSSGFGKFLVIVTIPIIVALVAIYVIPLMIDWDKQRAILIKNVADVTGREMSIDGNVQFSAFPTPNFSVTGIELKNAEGGSAEYMVRAEMAKAHLSMVSLLFGKVYISQVEFHNVSIELENFKDKGPNWNFAKGRMPDEVEQGSEKFDQFFGMDQIKINSGKLFFHSGDSSDSRERMLPMQDVIINMESINGPFAISGHIKSGIIEGELDSRVDITTGDLSSGEPAEFVMNINTGSSNINMEGLIKDWATYPNIEGRISGNVDYSMQSLSSYFGIDESVLPLGISTILSKEVTKIESNIFLSAKGAELRELTLNSSTTKGSGAVSITLGEINQIDAALNFEYLDIDKLLSERAGSADDGDKIRRAREAAMINNFASGKSEEEVEGPNFDIAEDLKFILDIHIAKARYNAHEFRDFRLKADIGMGATIIHSLSAKGLPGNSDVDISGTIEKEGISRISGQSFQSDIKARGDNLSELMSWLKWQTNSFNFDKMGAFEINGKAEFSQHEVKISRIEIKSGDINFLGQAIISYDKENQEKPVITSAFHINKLNLDDFMVKDTLSNADEVDANELQEIQDERRFDRLRTMNAYFRTISSRIVADEVIYDSKSYKDVSAIFLLEPGILDITDLKVTDGDSGKIEGKLKIDAKELRAKAELDIAAESFAFGEVAQDRRLSPVFSEEIFSLTRFGAMDTNFKFRFNNLDLGRLSIKKAIVEGSTNDEVINLTRFRGQLGGGHLDIKAVLGIQRASASASFSLVNADFNVLLKQLFGIAIVQQGRVSTSGTLSTGGRTIKGWMDNLEGAVTFTSRGLIIEGFDLRSLIANVDTFSAIDDLRTYTAKALSTGKTDVDYMAGNIFLQKGVMTMKNFTLSQQHILLDDFAMQIDMPKWTIATNAAFRINILNANERNSYQNTVPLALGINGFITNPNVAWDTRGIEGHWERKFYKRF